jgi:translation initiation factor 5A
MVHLVPITGSDLRIGKHAQMNGRPCKIIKCTTCKPGKHGAAKVNFIGIDIFTSRRYENSCSTADSLLMPQVSMTQYSVAYVEDDEYIQVLDEHGNMMEQLFDMPNDTDMRLKIAKYEDETDVFVTVLRAPVGDDMDSAVIHSQVVDVLIK